MKKMSTEYYILIETNICLGSSECIYSILDARSNLVTAESCREIVMKDVPASSFCAKCMLECLCASEIFEAEGLWTSLTDGWKEWSSLEPESLRFGA